MPVTYGLLISFTTLLTVCLGEYSLTNCYMCIVCLSQCQCSVLLSINFAEAATWVASTVALSLLLTSYYTTLHKATRK